MSEETKKSEFENYAKQWEKIYGFYGKGLPKSALEEVKIIYDKAKQDSDIGQLIKALIHKTKYIQEVEENAVLKTNDELLKELKTSTYPLTPVLHSMLADLYWKYYQQNRYHFLQRSTTVLFQQNDLATWDLKKIIEEIVAHYQASLQDTDKLQTTKIELLESVITPGTREGKAVRPTLYDFLAHRAIDFFADSEAGITQPAAGFYIKELEYFKNNEEFAVFTINTNDNLAFTYYAIKYLQDLTRFHLKDANPDALIDLTLKRLQFVYQKSILNNKEIHYENALKNILEQYQSIPMSAEIAYQLALFNNTLGDSYKPIAGHKYQGHKKKAIEVCQKAIKKYPGSFGAINCQYLINIITAKHVQMEIEQVNIINKPFITCLTFKNIQKIYFKLIKADQRKIEDRGLYREELVEYYLKKKAAESWSIAVPDEKDHQLHSTEIKMPPLKSGEYILIASTGENFKTNECAIAYSFLQISNISTLERKTSEKEIEFYLLHRDTGQPLTQAKIQTYYYIYDTKKNSYLYKKGKVFTADSNGFIHISYKDVKQDNFYVEFINGTDKLFSSQNYYLYRPYSYAREKLYRTFFFTDRAIYRPGQTVYFKGILVETDTKKPEVCKIIPNLSSVVTLYDVNYQKISSIPLKTNQYGTFSGSFQIPTGLLNGNMSIADSYGSINFSVEEYKRPKFEVTFQKAEETYKVNDIIKLKGNTIALAGYNIDNAAVKYRVVRNTYFIYWWYFYGYYPASAPAEIKNGVLKTNAEGEFSLDFQAIPDETIPKETMPAFMYTVYADVTDINGETRSSSKTIHIGYTALRLAVNMDETINQDDKKYITSFNSTNLSGEFIPARGQIAVYKLETPQYIYRNRLWNRPDKQILPKKEFHEAFPNDVYQDENNIYLWKKQKKVFESVFNTATNKTLQLNGIEDWQLGKYVIEMSSLDKEGQAVKEIKYFTLYSRNKKNLPYKQLDWSTLLTQDAEPGENAEVLIGSSAKDVRVIYEIEHKNKIVLKKFLTINNEQKKITIPIEEKHRGNVSIHLIFIKHNRVFQHEYTVNVPWSNKDLLISFETFRNKLSPGEKEEWRIKITGKDKDLVAAELLATLYDASLDTFKPHYWYFNLYPYYYSYLIWEGYNFFQINNSELIGNIYDSTLNYVTKSYDHLNWYGFYWRYYADEQPRKMRSKNGAGKEDKPVSMNGDDHKEKAKSSDLLVVSEKKANEEFKKDQDQKHEENIKKIPPQEKQKQDLSSVKARTNLNETAFFYPHLKTNEKGEVIISFTMPEALTRWKMLGLAHTKDLKFGLTSKELVTQKDLMVIPNPPRFLREGDKITFNSKITNLSDKELSGEAKLMLFDSSTMLPIDNLFNNQDTVKQFKNKKGQSSLITWDISIPEGLDAVTFRVVAKAGSFSDGEEQPLPIIKNSMLVTETLPLPIRAKQQKTYKLEKLLQSGASKTLKNHKLTLEFTSNPVWYAVQALPYLMEYPYECTEQTFTRFFANTIASYIVESNPEIKRVFDQWKKLKNTNALLSNLEKNQELKALLLQETPWVMDAKNESERKKRIALLFDLNKMADELNRALKKIGDSQMAEGGWAWFQGGLPNRYITSYIITGFARLHNLKVIDVRKNQKVWVIVSKGIPYLDNQIRKDYEYLIQNHIDLDKNNLGYEQIFYLYVRSFFQDIVFREENKKAFQYYLGQAKIYWLDYSRYMQGFIALALKRYQDVKTAEAIVKSIKEHALYSEEMGMYWKESYGYYWYQAPIETHSLLIEVFSEVTNDKEAVSEMKTWLLKQKQVQDWKTTIATANACYALLLQGENWLKNSQLAEITVGNKLLDPNQMPDVNIEAGTGYFKTSWNDSEIKPEMGEVKITNKNNMVAWGGLYWQYFENLDKITPHETPLSIKKKLFLEQNTASGPVISPITSETKLKIGDRIKVRIELRVDRSMEYVHMKDMRASGFEPENVISSYKWQDALGYYESTKDASTNFFIDYLPKGTYVFEYPLRVTHNGDFSNGITTIQCMYAPEFASHSEGVRVKVGE